MKESLHRGDEPSSSPSQQATAASTVSYELDRLAIIREPERKRLTQIARPTAFKWERLDPPKFPRRVRLPGGGVGWYAGEIYDWLSALPRSEFKKREAA
jgi:predicted DNA-binding transcriptional regulator AlpA